MSAEDDSNPSSVANEWRARIVKTLYISPVPLYYRNVRYGYADSPYAYGKLITSGSVKRIGRELLVLMTVDAGDAVRRRWTLYQVWD